MRSLAHPTNTLAVLTVDSDGKLPPAAPPSDPSGGPSPQRGAGAAYLMIGSVLLGVGLGYLLDRYLGTQPRWTIALSLTFLVVGVYQTIREANR